jgi:hypothetical protein
MKYFFVLFFVVHISAAQQVSTGLSFLKLGIGARPVAMGEAYTAISSDHASLYYNPASLSFHERNEIMLMHKQWIAETTTEYLGATILGGTWNYGFSVLSTSVSGIEVRLIPGEADGTFSSRNIAAGGTLSYRFNDALAAGISGKVLYEKIFIDEAGGFGIDLGVSYRYDEHLSLGVAIVNLGSMNRLRDQATDVPSTVRFGAAYASPLTESIGAVGAIDAVQTLKDDLLHIHTGVEFSYLTLASVRFGYQTGYEFRSFATGIGLRYASIVFDYAFVPFSGAFNSAHTFSLSFLL